MTRTRCLAQRLYCSLASSRARTRERHNLTLIGSALSKPKASFSTEQARYHAFSRRTDSLPASEPPSSDTGPFNGSRHPANNNRHSDHPAERPYELLKSVRKMLCFVTGYEPPPERDLEQSQAGETENQDRIRLWHIDRENLPLHSTNKSEDLPSQLRHVFRNFPQAIVICTSTSPDPDAALDSSSSDSKSDAAPQHPFDEHLHPHAMTMSSLTPLSMNPTPLVSLNIMTPSRTLDAIRGSGRFAVHILAPTGTAAEAAKWFSRRHLAKVEGENAEPGTPASKTHNVRSVFHHISSSGHIFDEASGIRGCRLGAGADSISTSEGPSGVRRGDLTMPPIMGGGAVLYAFICRIAKDVPNNGIFQVRDHAIVIGEVEEVVPGLSDEPATERGMVYSQRRYWKLDREVQ